MFACLLVPDFPVQAALLWEPKDTRESLRRSPIAVLEGPSNLPKVVALNDAARRVGIQVGMTKLQVETCGGVLLRKRSADHEDSTQAALLECAGRFSPRVESTCPGTVILDLEGTEKLFGPLYTTACKITVSARKIGFQLRIAIAANPDTAMYAARGFAGITLIPAGDESKTLAPLPVEILPVSPQFLEILNGWGIDTFQALAALPDIALVERLGQEGLVLQKLAQGRTSRPLLPVEPEPDFIASYEFEDAVESLEPLAFVLNRVLQEICDCLVAQSFATNEVRLTLDLEVRQMQGGKNGEQYKHDWMLPVPTQDRSMLFTLLRLDLERNTFSAPIKRVTVEAVPVKPRMAQGNLFAPPSPETEKLEITLARIRGVVGSIDTEGIACVGSPKILDTHRPGTFAVQSFSSATETRSPSAVVPTIALRVFRPALETSVELSGETPHLVRLWKKHRRVLAASGPWSSCGNWWNRSTPWAREEWDVALQTLEGVGYYRIYLDRIRKQWFVEGVFD
ncbi:MAG: DNA polymerase Y family protein [Acidobacteria bacterium]|nr:DNA polymerase Y family protein [Acidobacteriota bacterium]